MVRRLFSLYDRKVFIVVEFGTSNRLTSSRERYLCATLAKNTCGFRRRKKYGVAFVAEVAVVFKIKSCIFFFIILICSDFPRGRRERKKDKNKNKNKKQLTYIENKIRKKHNDKHLKTFHNAQ